MHERVWVQACVHTVLQQAVRLSLQLQVRRRMLPLPGALLGQASIVVGPPHTCICCFIAAISSSSSSNLSMAEAWEGALIGAV